MADASKTAALAKVRRIVVHAGLAHTDDIMACAMAYAYGVPHDAPIERRVPSQEDLDSPATLVLDVGGVHDPSHLDFDHHQRSREEPPKCSFKLLGEWLGADDELTTLFPWYTSWNLIDVLGGFATAKLFGSRWDGFEGLIDNPLADFVIRRFAYDPDFRRRTTLSLGNAIDLTRRLWTKLNDKAVFRTIAGLPAGDFTACATEEVSRCSDAWMRIHEPAFVMTRDSRGSGLSILRRNDDPRLDFMRCSGKPYALFCHSGGFLIKTQSRDDDVETIIRDALTTGQ